MIGKPFANDGTDAPLVVLPGTATTPGVPASPAPDHAPAGPSEGPPATVYERGAAA